MAAAEVEVLGSLVHVDRPFLVEDPAADLPFALAQSPQGRIDLDRQVLSQGWCCLQGAGVQENVVDRLDGLNAAGQPEASGFEDHPEEGHEPLRCLFLLSRGQGLEGGHGRLLEQVILVGCHVIAVGVGDPVDEPHVLGDPPPGFQPGLLIGVAWLIRSVGHHASGQFALLLRLKKRLKKIRHFRGLPANPALMGFPGVLPL